MKGKLAAESVITGFMVVVLVCSLERLNEAIDPNYKFDPKNAFSGLMGGMLFRLFLHLFNLLPLLEMPPPLTSNFSGDNPLQKKLDKAGFTGNIPFEFICPLTRQIMVNPVTTVTANPKTSGHTYEAAALETTRQSDGSIVCYITNDLIIGWTPNRILQCLIERWVGKQLKLSNNNNNKKALKNHGQFKSNNTAEKGKDEVVENKLSGPSL